MKERTGPRLHPPLARAVVGTLAQIFGEQRKASKAIEYTLKSNRKWGSRDRAFIAEHSYEIVRWWRLLHYLNGSTHDQNKSDTLWSILGIHLRLKGYDLPSWTEFRGIANFDFTSRLKRAKEIRKVRESIPDWIDEIGLKELGDNWDAELAALNKPADVFLRVNTSKTNRKDLLGRLRKEEVETEEVDSVSTALRVIKRKNLFNIKPFKEGLFEVQDAGSQMISTFLDVQPGMRVIDACAGAGGKTLHLSNLMSNKGSIIAMDTEAWKLVELKKRAKRNGAHNIEQRHIETSKVIKRLRGKGDRLLLDVPCTGLGVLRRNPDAKWKIDPDYLDKLTKLQADILQRYSQMLKVGGKMVYATCSILKKENQDQVNAFLEQHSNFKLIEEKALTPLQNGFDGFYMALLEKDS